MLVKQLSGRIPVFVPLAACWKSLAVIDQECTELFQKLLWLLYERGVSAVLENRLGISAAITLILVKDIAGLTNHRLRRIYIFAGIIRNQAQFAESAKVEQRII